MSRRRRSIPLTDQDRDDLQQFVRAGTKSARAITRAHILLSSASGEHTIQSICQTLHVCSATVCAVRQRYLTAGVAATLSDKPRSGQPRRVTPRVEAQITTLACSDPPSGRDRWTIQLLTDQLVAVYNIALSDESVRQVLKKVV